MRKRSYSDSFQDKIDIRSKNDSYFALLKHKEKLDMIQKEDMIYNSFQQEKPLRYRILDSKYDISIKYFILQKINQYETMSEESSEYIKLKKWIDGLSHIPFDIYSSFLLNKNWSKKEIKDFLCQSMNILNKTIYGQQKAKNKMIEIIAQWIQNPSCKNQVIALKGSPGVGKTSFVKNGVSKVLQKPFSFYSLGGASDISCLEGHHYTYEGSTWGRISEILMESKVMDPILFFDELDKINDSTKSDQINGFLIHLTDSTQNNHFTDKYFSGVPLDLSRALIFFSFNDIDKINPILKDRLTIIEFDNYNKNDKKNICKEFLIPEIMNNIGIDKKDIIIDDYILDYILDKITKDIIDENGVRSIKKYFENLIMKINVMQYVDIYHKGNIQFPYKITKKLIDDLVII